MSVFVVVYDPDGKNKANWVPKQYILQPEKNMVLGTRKMVFYHSNKYVKLPRGDIVKSLIKSESKTKLLGYFYPASIISSFGK